MFDVIVVGAGPVGSYTARRLTEEGLEVALLEEDEEVGKDVICTGIIGKESFDEFDLPKIAVISNIKSVCFFSPSHFAIDYTPSFILAHVVDRGLFDQEILRGAVEAGVDVRLGKRVVDVKINKDFGEVQTEEERSLEKIRGRVIVLATGVSCKLHKQVGLSVPPAFLQGTQVETKVKDGGNTEIYFGRHIAPASFAWVVPLGNSQARVGALTRNRGVSYLKDFLRETLKDRVEETPEVMLKPIAHGPISRSANDRVLAVGEAAGQVKTTTGGGIIYGLICSEIATQVLKKAFHRGDVSYRQLRDYERLWKSRLGKELRMGKLARNILGKLSDKQIDRTFKFVGEKPKVKELMEREFKFDSHSDLISFGLKLLKGVIWP